MTVCNTKPTSKVEDHVSQKDREPASYFRQKFLTFRKIGHQLLQGSRVSLWAFASGHRRCPFSIIYCLAEEALMREESDRIGSWQSKWKCGTSGEQVNRRGKNKRWGINEFPDKKIEAINRIQQIREGERKKSDATCGSPTAQQIPIVAPMLSPIHKLTAWIQPRTWIMPSKVSRCNTEQKKCN